MTGVIKEEKYITKTLLHAIRHEQIFWAQKARIKWLQNGDLNTKFFHLNTVQRRQANKITRLQDNRGRWIEEEGDLKNYVRDFYADLFA